MTRLHRMALPMALAVLAAACDAPERARTEAEAEGTAALAETGEAEEELIPINQSGVRGSARVTRDDDEAVVAVRVGGLRPGERYAANVHQGRCAAGGALILPLGRLTAGQDSVASSRMRVSGASLPEGTDLFVQVYGPDDRPVACADVAGGDEPPVTDEPQTDEASEASDSMEGN